MYITDEWILIKSQAPTSQTDTEYYLMNVETQQQIPLIKHDLKHDLTQEISPDILSLLYKSDTVYVKGGAILALPEPIGNSTDNHHVVIGTAYIGNLEYGQQVAENLYDFGITPIIVSGNVSIDGSFYYPSSSQSIYDSVTDQPIVIGTMPNFIATGWAYQQQGIILSANPTYLIGEPSFVVSAPAPFLIPQPILLLRQDPQYLPPDVQAQFAAQDALEARNKQQADMVMVVLMVATVGTIAFAIRTHRRLAHRKTPI